MTEQNKTANPDDWTKNVREMVAYNIIDHVICCRFDVATKGTQIGCDMPIYLDGRALKVDKEEMDEVRAQAYKTISEAMKEQGIDPSELIPLRHEPGYKKPKYIEPD